MPTGQDNLLANPGSTAESVCTPPSSDTAGLWTPAPTKRRRAYTKCPPASPPRNPSQDPKKSKDSAFSSPIDVEDFVTLPPIKILLPLSNMSGLWNVSVALSLSQTSPLIFSTSFANHANLRATPGMWVTPHS